MKKAELIAIVNSGVLNITNHTLEPAQAYKVVKFRSEVKDKFSKLHEAEQALIKDAGIEDGQAFDKELAELRAVEKPGKEQKARLEEMEGKLKRFGELRAELLKEEVALDCKKMPYDAWHQLQKENAEKEINGRKVDLLPNWVEDLLCDVLWEAPADEEN